MQRSSFAVRAVVIGAVLWSHLSAASALAQAGAAGSSAPTGGAPAGAPITAAEAAPFIGDWTIPVTSTVGSYSGYITLKVEENAVVAVLGSDVFPEQRTTDIVKSGKGITIRAKMDYEGLLVEKPTPVGLTVTLTPSGDYIAAGLDFRINNKSFFITSTGKRLNQ